MFVNSPSNCVRTVLRPGPSIIEQHGNHHYSQNNFPLNHKNFQNINGFDKKRNMDEKISYTSNDYEIQNNDSYKTTIHGT